MLSKPARKFVNCENMFESRSNGEVSPMVDRKAFPRLGICVYGSAAIALGVVGLAWGDFATNWQRVPANVPHREPLAYIAAIYEFVAGVAIVCRRTARIGTAMLTILYFIFALLWVAQIFQSPQVYDVWGNFFEEFSLVVAGAVGYATVAPRNSAMAGRAAPISRVYGVCVISFAIEHLFYLSGTAGFVPKWIPPAQMFWAVATAIFFLLAAAAILSGILATLASRLLTAMIVCFEVLVWLPKLFASPHVHFVWAGNAICIALAAGAWVVSDSIAGSRQAPAPQNPAA
jgi:uncharacterized membrane protein YphA (DoxX/SURF4 family)